MKNEKLPVRQVEVDAEWDGTRLDRFVARQVSGIPHSAVARWLRTGQVRVNGGRAKGDRRVVSGDVVRLPPAFIQEEGEERTIPGHWLTRLAAGVLHRDEQLLVLNKPAGLSVHGGSSSPFGVVDVARLLFPGEVTPELVHRLDRETSGCLVMGCTPSSVRQLGEAFASGGVEKGYLALVKGHPRLERGSLNDPLRKSMGQGGEKVRVEAGGEPARTDYRVVERFANCSLVEAWPRTGRTHQIRVHFAHAGHPLAGDDKYGEWAFNRVMRAAGLRRLFLHARDLTLAHPANGARVHFHAPLDPSLESVLKGLRRGGQGV